MVEENGLDILGLTLEEAYNMSDQEFTDLYRERLQMVAKDDREMLRKIVRAYYGMQTEEKRKKACDKIVKERLTKSQSRDQEPRVIEETPVVESVEEAQKDQPSKDLSSLLKEAQDYQDYLAFQKWKEENARRTSQPASASEASQEARQAQTAQSSNEAISEEKIAKEVIKQMKARKIKRLKLTALAISLVVGGSYFAVRFNSYQNRKQEDLRLQREMELRDELNEEKNSDYDYPPIHSTYEEEPMLAWEIYRQVPYDAETDSLEELSDTYHVGIGEIEMCNDPDSMREYGIVNIPYQVSDTDLQESLETVYLNEGETMEQFTARTETALVTLTELNPDSFEDSNCLTSSLLVPNFSKIEQINEAGISYGKYK